MSVLTGAISPYGPLIHFKAMQSRQRVEALKKAGISFSSPVVGMGLLDTGASCSALENSHLKSGPTESGHCLHSHPVHWGGFPTL